MNDLSLLVDYKMRDFKEVITLDKNARGCWCLDPLKGCSNKLNKYNSMLGFELQGNRGCYGICYANRIASGYGYDFSKIVKRNFIDDNHFNKIAGQLKDIPFVRLGVSCDPSDNWDHTIEIIEKIRPYIKNIVVITKHLTELTDIQCEKLKGVCVNTSIAALDSQYDIDKRLFWYHKLKDYCNSVLRVCTADFNDAVLEEKQNTLLKNENVIDNILRFPESHELVQNGIINVKRYKFLDKECFASKHEENIYFGDCDNCPDMCGIK
ncbi:MAG: hypothetical protein GY861_13780 [bacterium]|nr:hypothetical protein [bacterium]